MHKKLNLEKISIMSTNLEGLKVGQRVILLLENNINKYEASRRNPFFDTKFYCPGTIIEIRKEIFFPVVVKWDNGYVNKYEYNVVTLLNNENITIKSKNDVIENDKEYFII